MVLAAAPSAMGEWARQSDLGLDQPLPLHIVQEVLVCLFRAWHVGWTPISMQRTWKETKSLHPRSDSGQV